MTIQSENPNLDIAYPGWLEKCMERSIERVKENMEREIIINLTSPAFSFIPAFVLNPNSAIPDADTESTANDGGVSRQHPSESFKKPLTCRDNPV